MDNIANLVNIGNAVVAIVFAIMGALAAILQIAKKAKFLKEAEVDKYLGYLQAGYSAGEAIKKVGLSIDDAIAHKRIPQEKAGEF